MRLREHVKQVPTLIIGCGTISRLGQTFLPEGRSNVLIIVEPTLEKTAILHFIKSSLTSRSQKVQLFYVRNIKSKLTKTKDFPNILLARKYDVIIGIGNNDLLNYTKLVAEFLNDVYHPSTTKSIMVTKDEFQVILLPTSPTTGIELKPIVYQYDTHVQQWANLKEPYISTVIYDPLIVKNKSSYTITSTAIKTLAEAIETHFFIKKPHPFPFYAYNLITNYIVRATYRKGDLEALEALLRAGMFLGLTKNKRKKYSLVQCFAIPIMRKVDTVNSVLYAILLPYVIYMYRQVNESRGVSLVNQLDLPFETVDHQYAYLSARLANVLKTVGYPTHLRALGITQDCLGELAFAAYTLWSNNELVNVSWCQGDFQRIYEKAYRGKIEQPFT